MEARDGSEDEVWSLGPDLWGSHRNDHRLCVGWLDNLRRYPNDDQEAVLASQAAICVSQFMKEPNHEKNLKELGEVSTGGLAGAQGAEEQKGRIAQVIEKGGWDQMPGQAKAGYAVARACVDGLELLFKVIHNDAVESPYQE